MTIKIKALAEKLGLTNKEVVNKAVSMGIEAKTASSNISIGDAKLVEEKLRADGVVKDTAKDGDTKEEQKGEGASGSKRLFGRPVSKAESERIKKHTSTPASKAKKEDKSLENEDLLEKTEMTDSKADPVSEVSAEKNNNEKKVEPAVKTQEKSEEKPQEKTEVKPEVKEEKPEVKKVEPKGVPMFRGPKVVKKAEDIEREEKERAAKAAEAKAKEKEKAKEKSKAKNDSDKKKNRKEFDRKSDNKDRKDNRDNRDNKDRKDNRKNNKGDVKPVAFQESPVEHKENRKSRKKDKDKDRDKRDMEDRRNGKGKSGSNPYGEKSLEKKEKKKKKQKSKPQEVEVEVEMEQIPVGTKVINVPITVAGYCEQVGVSVSNVIMTLMKLGIVTNINANLDEDTVTILSEELGVDVVIGEITDEELDEGLELFEDKEEDLVGRSPIITVMGHVDHGKTSLLDAIRATNVTAKESGGITQHIGASEVRLNGHKIVFLDTPGHEAFTAMRARGADITDIAVLVVAADDSVKPQTIESISHAKAAGVPIIVAINTMDKPAANPDLVKKDLADNGVLVEDWGGDVITVPVSAKTGMGIEALLEMILLQAEVLELKANPKRLGLGTVIEARLDKAKGPVATLLVTNGTVKSGQSLVAGNTSGRIRLMTDYKGKTIKKAGPATAVEILGLSDVPAAGDDFHVVKDDKTAREIADRRMQKFRKEVLARNASSTLEELFSQIKEGEVKDLNLIIKGDVRGSVGAVVSSLEKLSNEEVRVRIIHSGVGAVTESDVTLASTSGAIIIGFNVRPATGVQAIADRENVQIRPYRVIYNIIEDVENAMKGMLDPEFKEVVIGQAEVRNTFKVPGVGTIGGCYVTDGKVARNAEVRIVRDGIVIHEGSIGSLKRFKDDAKEVQQGYECGIGIESYNDVKEGDVIVCFQMEEVARD